MGRARDGEAMAAQGALHGGKPLPQTKTAASPPGMGAGRFVQAKHSLRASRVHTSTSGSTCLGIPKESGAGPGGREDPNANLVPRKGSPFLPGHLCSWWRGGSKEKSREKQVLGLVAGELSWRQVQELNHIVKELHGPHNVLVLQGRGGKWGGWVQNSNLSSSPQTSLYYHGSSELWDKSPKDYR